MQVHVVGGGGTATPVRISQELTLVNVAILKGHREKKLELANLRVKHIVVFRRAGEDVQKMLVHRFGRNFREIGEWVLLFE